MAGCVVRVVARRIVGGMADAMRSRGNVVVSRCVVGGVADTVRRSVVGIVAWRVIGMAVGSRLARAMGGDAPLMAALTSLEHLLSALTLPCWILLLQAMVLRAGP